MNLYFAKFTQANFIYPCRLFDLYATDVYSLPTQTSFDYLIRSRYLDFLRPFLLTDTDNLTKLIAQTWQASNNLLSLSQINVNLAETKIYSSILTK